MTEYFDTHCHFECPENEIAGLLERAASSGVTRIVAVGGSETLNKGVDAAFKVSQSPGMPKVYRAVGYDRDHAHLASLPPLNFTDACAVGEIGLDYHYEGPSHEEQKALFAHELDLAHKLDFPVIIHTREADDDTLAILREIPSRGIIHSFTGSPQFCKQLLDLGFMISISGIVTFRAAGNVRETALVVPDDRLLIETDTPFLAPVPKRGKPNEPAFVVHTAQFLAELRHTPPEDFARLTTENTLRTLRTE